MAEHQTAIGIRKGQTVWLTVTLEDKGGKKEPVILSRTPIVVHPKDVPLVGAHIVLPLAEVVEPDDEPEED